MMSKRSRRELLLTVAPRYRTAKRTEPKRILDEFVASAGNHRKYAIHLLLKHPLAKTLGRTEEAAALEVQKSLA